jgi:hypothetical protein
MKLAAATGRAVLLRMLLLLGLVGLGLHAGAGVAAAHGDGGIGPEAHVPRLLALDPPVPGLVVTVIESGARLRIDNGTGVQVEVVPPDHPSHTDVPAVALGSTARWADPRVSAAAADPAPAEGRRAWTVPLLVGDQPVAVRGEQVWPPAPSSVPWWLATLVAMAAAATVAIRAATRRGWAPALAGVTLLVAAGHLVHVIGGALIVEERGLLGVVLGAAGPALLAWVLAPVGAALTLAGRAYGPLLCALVGGVFTLVTAFTANNFGAAVLPFAGPADLDRAAVALTLGGGLGLFLAGFAALRVLTPAESAQPRQGP